MDYLKWLSEIHEELAKRYEFPVNGAYINYIKDYRKRQGRMVRATATLNFKLRPQGPSADELAITHMLNSVEVQ